MSAAVVAALFGRSSADDWPRFRGPNGGGLSDATTVPTRWSEDDVRWKIPLSGVGHGSPVVCGTRLFVQCEEDEGRQRLVVCIDPTDGRTLWLRRFASATHRQHAKNSFASSTPAVDSEHVYAAWAVPEKLTLVALDHEGETVWERDLGPFRSGHGFAASPIVYDGLVVLGNEQEGQSSLIAVDRQTGATRWQAPRRSQRTTYSTPCVYAPAGRTPELIFTNWRHGITAVDPATGRVNWQISVFDQNQPERAIGSPVVAGELIIGTCGFVNNPKHVVAVRPGAGEDAREIAVEEVYRIERAVPHIPTPLVHDGRLYLWSDAGIVTCCDVHTGRRVWQRRVGGNFFGSPVCVAGRLFCVNDAGDVVVLAASDEFQELARNPLGEPCHSTPAVANGMMFLRTERHLHAIGGE
ncbi:MAG TPA: PQQ-binding-like beta-propeller repeat protein [Planctomycetaceae bacterium]|nr:PQQ-binding-like beta-propeller repeat protein [Planctomycetaceae bacterium]